MSSAAIQNRFGMPCPHCLGPAATRTSREVTRLARDIYFQCQTVECGHTFVAQLAIIRTLAPSANPDPRVHLPVATPAARRGVRPANDNSLNGHATG